MYTDLGDFLRAECSFSNGPLSYSEEETRNGIVKKVLPI